MRGEQGASRFEERGSSREGHKRERGGKREEKEQDTIFSHRWPHPLLTRFYLDLLTKVK